MSGHSPHISEKIQRAIRQRCGFGCVVCGLPLYEYEHMQGWANVRRHEEAEITLLCDRHHREKTNGLFPLDAVRAADNNPYNLRAGVSPPYGLHFAGVACELHVGSVEVTSADLGPGEGIVALTIDRTPVMS